MLQVMHIFTFQCDTHAIRQKLKEVVHMEEYVKYLPQSKIRPFYHTRIVVPPTAVLHSLLDMVITAVLVII